MNFQYFGDSFKIIVSWIFLLATLTCLPTYLVMREPSPPHISDSWPGIQQVRGRRHSRQPAFLHDNISWKARHDPHWIWVVDQVIKKPCSQPKQYLSREAIRDYFSYPCSACCLSIQLLSSSSCHLEPSIIQTK